MKVASSTLTARRAWLLGAATCALVPTGLLAQAVEPYPSRPITLVVPFPAGGTTDMLARVLAVRLSDALAVPVVVSNRQGAGGNIGAAAVAKAAPDGYTLLMGSIGTQAINQSLYAKMPYDAVRDFSAISRVANVPNVLVVHPAVPATTVPELIALAKRQPDALTYGSAGNGSSIHLSAELFKSMAKLQMRHVPYSGSAPAMNALLGGQVSMMFDNLPSALPQIKAGRLRAIAVTSEQRAAALPDVPTIAQAGMPGYAATSWFGLLAPARTPPEIIARVNREVTRILESPATRAQIVEMGADPHPEPAAQFEAFITRETTKWAAVVKGSGARMD